MVLTLLSELKYVPPGLISIITVLCIWKSFVFLFSFCFYKL